MPVKIAALIALLSVAAAAAPANATLYYGFTSSGTATGRMASTGETFAFASKSWAGSGTYGEAGSAYIFQITFAASQTISAASMIADGKSWASITGPGPFTSPAGGTPAAAYFAPTAGDLTTGRPFSISITFANGVDPNYALAGDWVAVPEPASLAVFGLGLAGLGLVRRRSTG